MKKYELHQQFVSPFLIRNLSSTPSLIGVVNKNNEVIVENEKLKIIDNSLPEGTEVIIGLNNQFFCYLSKDYKKDLEEKKLEKKQRKNNEEKYKIQEMNKAEQYITTFVKKNTSKKIGLNLIEYLNQEIKKTYHLYKASRNNTKIEQLNLLYIDYEVACFKINFYIELMYKKFGYKHNISYAYSPRERENTGGKYHIVLEENFSVGRIKRELGDTLCSKSKKFWGLTNLEQGSVNCKKCIENIIKTTLKEK